jgi:hypothetical protein
VVKKNWPNTPLTGDILNCRFPLDEYPNVPGPTPRPVLVVGNMTRYDRSLLVIVVYGTAQNTTSQTSHSIGPDELEIIPLKEPLSNLLETTVFRFTRPAVLLFDSIWFPPYQNTGKPKRGALSDKTRINEMEPRMKNQKPIFALPSQKVEPEIIIKKKAFQNKSSDDIPHSSAD